MPAHQQPHGAKENGASPVKGPPRLENYSRAAGFSGVGQSGIDTVGERADVVSQGAVGAVHHDCDGRQDKRVFRHRLGAMETDEALTYFKKSLCKQIHLSLLLDPYRFIEAYFWFCL